MMSAASRTEGRSLFSNNCAQTAAAIVWLVVAFLWISPSLAQGQSRLQRIEVIGLKRHTQDQVVKTSGLQIGQTVDPATLDAAAQKLISSGLFKKVGYHLRSAGQQTTVTFTVEEATRRLPVSFDNFIWFKESEIYSWLRTDVPAFDGTVPDGSDIAQKVAASLQKLLNERKISGHVEFMPFGDESGRQQILFRVAGAKLPVCELSFPGAKIIAEEDLIRTANSLLHTDYSSRDVAQYVIYTLLPLYHHLGYLHAQFGSPLVALPTAATDGCKDGVAVTLPIEEGLPYSWDKAEWVGNHVLSSEQLSAALGLKSGELADDRIIDKALKTVVREYGRKGYMAVRWNESLSFDDASQRVTYRFDVTEGPQFRMSELTVIGLSEQDSQRVKDLWQLKPGTIFDQVYLDEFVAKSVRDFLDKHPVFSGVPLRIGAETKLNSEKQTVDVIITFK